MSARHARAQPAAAALLGLLCAPFAHAQATPVRLALVIGNNQAPSGATETLRYADDDALATTALLQEAGVHAVVLTRLDEATQRLHPSAAPYDAPTRAGLVRALDELARHRDQARAAGLAVELVFSYSGHGDVERGEGWLALEQGRLSRRELHERLIARLAPDASHLIIDACRSSFMAYARGPGGQRAPVAPGFSRPGAAGRVGYLLSTSSERDSHEWEGFQAGVFSHEVRSALRGAADVDGDRRLTYAELGAFLASVNAGVVNERMRPDVLVLPPGDEGAAKGLDDAVLGWPEGSTLVLDEGRAHAEDEVGLRLLDAPPAPAPLAVHLPRERRLYLVTEGGERMLEPGSAATHASALPAAPRTVAARGAAHDTAFRALFSAPFGPDDVARYRARAPDELPGAAPLEPLPLAAWGTLGASSALALGALGAAGAGWVVYLGAIDAPQVERVQANDIIAALNLGAAIGGGAAALGGTAALALFLVDAISAASSDDAWGDPP